MHKTVIFCLVYSQILWEIYIWSIFKDFVHMLFLITKLKMSKFVKITQKILYFTIKPYKMYSILKIWSKYPEFRIRNFSGFSGSGFFPGKKQCADLREVRLCIKMPCLNFCTRLYLQFFGGRRWQTWKMQKTHFI